MSSEHILDVFHNLLRGPVASAALSGSLDLIRKARGAAKLVGAALRYAVPPGLAAELQMAATWFSRSRQYETDDQDERDECGSRHRTDPGVLRTVRFIIRVRGPSGSQLATGGKRKPAAGRRARASNNLVSRKNDWQNGDVQATLQEKNHLMQMVMRIY